MNRRWIFAFALGASICASGSVVAAGSEHRESHAGAPAQVLGHGTPTQTNAAPAAATPVARATIVTQHGSGAVRAGVVAARPTVDNSGTPSSYVDESVDDDATCCYRVFIFSGNTADEGDAASDGDVPSSDDSEAVADAPSDEAWSDARLSTVDFSVFD